MALLWGTTYLQNTLPEELLERFDDIKADRHLPLYNTLPLYNGETGELVVNIPGGTAVRVNREKLLSEHAVLKVATRVTLSPDVYIAFCFFIGGSAGWESSVVASEASGT